MLPLSAGGGGAAVQLSMRGLFFLFLQMGCLKCGNPPIIYLLLRSDFRYSIHDRIDAAMFSFHQLPAQDSDPDSNSDRWLGSPPHSPSPSWAEPSRRSPPSPPLTGWRRMLADLGVPYQASPEIRGNIHSLDVPSTRVAGARSPSPSLTLASRTAGEEDDFVDVSMRPSFRSLTPSPLWGEFEFGSTPGDQQEYDTSPASPDYGSPSSDGLSVEETRNTRVPIPPPPPPAPAISLRQRAQDAADLLEKLSNSSVHPDDASSWAVVNSALAITLKARSELQARIARKDSERAPVRGGGEGMTADSSCVLCYQQSADIVFRPCGHLLMCAVCQLGSLA